ncbi:hypothetical protein SH2C18_15220 [Clostridium sediminicola]
MRRGTCFFALNAEANSTTTRVSTITNDDNPISYTYDDMEFSWEHGRQFKSMGDGTKSLSFKYNSSGIRTEKIVGAVTTKYHLEGDKVTFESNDYSTKII